MNGATSATVAEPAFHRVAVPPNARGKRYTMGEIFEVWHANQDAILSYRVPASRHTENYKLAQPSPIYHLELRGNENATGETNGDALTLSVQALLVDDDAVASATQHVANVLGLSLPPGLQTTAAPSVGLPALIASDKIEWVYVDPSGTEQGPFNGDMMQEWLTDGYLHLDLRIRRKEEREFKTLKELCERVQNYIHPFKIPLPDLGVIRGAEAAAQPPLHQFLGANEPLNLGAAGMRLNAISQPTLFGQDLIPSPDPFAAQSAFPSNKSFGLDALNFGKQATINNMPTLLPQLQQPHHQAQPQQLLARTNSGWGLNNTGFIGSSPGTPISVPSVLQNTLNQPTPVSPWLTGGPSRVSSPFIPTTSLTDKIAQAQDPVLGPGDIEPVQTQTQADDEPSQALSGAAEVSKPEAEAAPTQTSLTPSPAPDATVVASTNVPDASEVPPSLTSAAPSAVSSAPSKPMLAPWASKEAKSQKPKLTLKEIQKLEAEELRKQKDLQQKLNEQAAKAAAQLWKEEQAAIAAKQVPSLPKTSGWASLGTVPAVSKKTLADIQREEAEAAALRASKTAAASPLASVSRQTSFASAIANSVPKDDGTWTVVPKKSAAVAKKPTKLNPIVNLTTSKVDPQMLRSVSAVKPATMVNENAIREDFLVWARSSMTNLYALVSKDDLLDIFLTLPLSSDSSLLISETIYSSSATMDGRRFAKDFLEKRAKVEQQVGPSNDWSAAIIASADRVPVVDEDGWSTGKKRKGRR